MAEDQDSKTEQASAKKLEDAREKGQVVNSREVTSWFGMLAITTTVMIMAPGLARSVAASLMRFIEEPHAIRLDETLAASVFETVDEIALALALPLAIAMGAGIAGTVVQSGIVFATDRLRPQLDHISLIQGWSRLVSMRVLVEFGKSLGKIAIVAAVATWLLLPEVDGLQTLPTLDSADLLREMHRIATRLVMGVTAALTAIALADYGWTRFSFMKSMRMSRQEMKEEYRQQEGDPLVKGKLKRLRMERARRRMMAAVPEASVVITNPTHFAVALKYDLGDRGAPTLVAKGADVLAAKIREVAGEHDIPIVENPPLARALYAAVDLDEEVPPEHYKAVAEVISYVFRLKGKIAPAARQTAAPTR